MGGKIDNRPNLILFGDSITVGEYISPHLTWATRIAAAVEAWRPKWRTIVAARNGDTTRTALERMDFDVLRYGKVDVLVTQFGHNDGHIWQTAGGVRVVPSSYVQNLAEIHARAQRFGCKDILHIVPHRVDLPDNKEYEGRLDQYRLAQFKDRPRVMQIVIENSDLLDGLHLSEEGHRVYFQDVLPIVQLMIRRVEES